MRESSTHRIGADGKFDPNGKPDPDSNSDNKSVPPGATKVLMDREGPGAITHIWITFLGPEPQDWAKAGSANHQEMLLRMTWDDQKTPSVEAPLGDFFACGFGIRTEILSLPVVVEDADSYNCFWRMPFRKHAKIEIVNQSDKPISLLYYNIDWIKLDSMPDETPYFYARYRQEYPNEQGKDYLVLDTQGKGHYVGTVLSVRTRSPSWFGEGDEKIYIDGESDASIWGTGTEDYFLSAWGLKKTSTPYFGVGYFDEWGIVGGHTCAYRWHIQDPIVFSKGIRVTFEHYGWISPDENPKNISDSWNQRQDDYSSVAFWYQTGTPTFDAPVPHAKERKLPNLDRIISATARPIRPTTAKATRRRRIWNSTSNRNCCISRRRPRTPGSRSPSPSRRKNPSGCWSRPRPVTTSGSIRSRLTASSSAGRWICIAAAWTRGKFICWISGPSPANTNCGWNASAKTACRRDITWASNPCGCGNAARAWSNTASTRTRTGRKIRRSIDNGCSLSKPVDAGGAFESVDVPAGGATHRWRF